jgi:hypothetical protein
VTRRPADPGGTDRRSPRTLLGQIVLAVSGLGFPLTQAVIARGGRRGAIVAEGVAVGQLFGLHTYRFWIYLGPDRGLRATDEGAPRR